MINKYNQIIEQIVDEFARRYYKECFNEREYKDFQLMDYQGINDWPLEICDEFYSINDILITIKHNIPLQITRERYNKQLDAHMEDKIFWINLYNYYLRNKDNQKYYENHFESLKKSKKAVEVAKEELEKAILGAKK